MMPRAVTVCSSWCSGGRRLRNSDSAWYSPDSGMDPPPAAMRRCTATSAERYTSNSSAAGFHRVEKDGAPANIMTGGSSPLGHRALVTRS